MGAIGRKALVVYRRLRQHADTMRDGMPLLYYWRGDNYRRDLDYGAGYHLNQANPLLHEIAIGDSLWAFTRRNDGVYVLAAELIVRAKTRNLPNFRYGAYRLWGDLDHSRYFLVSGQPSIDGVIRALSVSTNADVLGRSFQGYRAVRRITEHDHQILMMAARTLPLEPRARILPEERLEAAILLGSPDVVQALIAEESPGIARARREYLYGVAPTRSRRLVRQLQEMYEGRCQLCDWDPRSAYDHDICHGHHIHWLSRGGEDSLANLVLLCPNDHAAIHACDAPFDYADGAFVFGTQRMYLTADNHIGST